MEKLLISACLLGAKCRYDGKSMPSAAAELAEKFHLVPFCPEIYGGLPTPRPAAEISGGRVVTELGDDVTENYKRGAEEALRLAKTLGIKKAVLKERSPSCGSGKIYDGTFSGNLTDGDGITARLLKENGIEIYGESEYTQA